MIRIKKRLIILCAFAVILVALIIWTLWENTALEINEYTVTSEELPIGFD